MFVQKWTVQIVKMSLLSILYLRFNYLVQIIYMLLYHLHNSYKRKILYHLVKLVWYPIGSPLFVQPL